MDKLQVAVQNTSFVLQCCRISFHVTLLVALALNLHSNKAIKYRWGSQEHDKTSRFPFFYPHAVSTPLFCSQEKLLGKPYTYVHKTVCVTFNTKDRVLLSHSFLFLHNFKDVIHANNVKCPIFHFTENNSSP